MTRRIATPLIVAAAAAVMLFGRPHGADPPTQTGPAATAESGTPTRSETPPPDQPSAPSSSMGGSPATPEPTQPGQGPAYPTMPVAAQNPQQTTGFGPYMQAAEAFMADYARPPSSVTEQQWWAKVAAHLTDAAAAAYAGTDPQNVPFTTVTGPVIILLTATPPDPAAETPNDLLLLARVLTDAGWYRVEMTTLPEGIRIVRATPEHGPS